MEPRPKRAGEGSYYCFQTELTGRWHFSIILLICVPGGMFSTAYLSMKLTTLTRLGPRYATMMKSSYSRIRSTSAELASSRETSENERRNKYGRLLWMIIEYLWRIPGKSARRVPHFLSSHCGGIKSPFWQNSSSQKYLKIDNVTKLFFLCFDKLNNERERV